MEYLCVATSVEGFIQQLAVAYITHGYWFYVAGTIPEEKDPATVDVKLIERYGIAISKWSRCRRKKQGLANMQYLRYQRSFVLLATNGRHEFFDRERASFRDVRRVPITFAVYRIGCRKGLDGRWHPSVRITREYHRELKALLVEHGLQRGMNAVRREFAECVHPPFAPITRQFLEVWRAVNRARCKAAMDAIPIDVIPRKRRIIRPFGDRPDTETCQAKKG